MPKNTIITGGAGGMGLAVARVIGRDHHVIICDLDQARLDIAIEQLSQSGISCEAVICDITKSTSVDALFDLALNRGELASVVHAAGISPQMADAETIMRVNAAGTINITEAAYAIATEGFALVNVASMAAYMLPELIIPRRAYSHAFTNAETMVKKALLPCRFMPGGLYRNGLSYAISKNFVVWYSKKNAARFGLKKARILSVSPGTFDTEMGRLEEKSGSVKLLEKAALKRSGQSKEIAELLGFCASDRAGYLTGTDILCDGGVIASRL